MITVILMEPRKQTNIGAVARIMKNFGFENLVFINPKCKKGVTARNVAKHANDLLANAKTRNHSYLEQFDYVIGTTAILGRDYNLVRNPITPQQCAHKVSQLKKTNIALLIGREGEGLTNEELKQCDMLVTIPAFREYPTLNISHAVSILLYELFLALNAVTSSSHIKRATKKDKEILNMLVHEALNSMSFMTPDKKETQNVVWKRIIGKATLTKREALTLMGFLRKVK